MRDILVVMKFTMREMIKRKSFIVSTLIILAVIVVGFNVPNIISIFNDNKIPEKENISIEPGMSEENISNDNLEMLLISDEDEIFKGKEEVVKEKLFGYNVVFEDISFDDIKKKINDGEVDSSIIIKKNDGNIEIKYCVENISFTSSIPNEIENGIKLAYSDMQLLDFGISKNQIEDLRPMFLFGIEQVGEKKATGNIFSMMMMSLLLFYAIYFCAYQVSSSITTEKTSKIMETLVTSTSPKTIVIGKTIGIGIVGLLQMTLFVGTALICATFFVDKEILSMILDLSSITPFLGIVTIIYFILGYAVYSLLFALTGSTVSKPEDIQSANTPVALLVVFGFYLSYFTMMNPTSKLNLFASMFPFSSSFCMPFRVMMGLADVKDVMISVVILVITIMLVAKVAIKIYSNAIINYGAKMNLKDIFRMYKQK